MTKAHVAIGVGMVARVTCQSQGDAQRRTATARA